jgi:hypothetical protein
MKLHPRTEKLIRQAAEVLCTVDRLPDYTEKFVAALEAGGVEALREAMAQCAAELRTSIEEGMEELRRAVDEAARAAAEDLQS